jgi:hypothetical protein
MYVCILLCFAVLHKYRLSDGLIPVQGTSELPNSWRRVLLEKLTVTQQSGNSQPFREPESSLPRSQDPITGPYAEAFSPHLPTLFL